ncbi:hypothetical protein CVT25_010165 [Psilocybe cyanescens]|uniref:Uncharacterized protein n=1 Tax=Psilocybe cyanescens TaxID=93625 RepID=A0A409XJ69_PSICY|nr:hypothetical protein CVT25_010165 [Psilocybe cyanescens]
MSLDKNLFTLNFTQHKDNPTVIDLVDPTGIIHYRKQRVSSPEYKIEVYDPMSESLLATASALSPTSKVKTLELCNPTSVVELKYTGTLSFRWAFKWEEHEYEWKREECYMIRKPDPPVIVAVTREPAGRLKTTSVQILDYNLNRFDIDDRKGLEIVILTSLLTFQDANEAVHNPESSVLAPSASLSTRSATIGSSASSGAAPPPPPPPKPAPKTGIDRIAEIQAMKGEYNEIIISEEGNLQDYAEYCNTLLQDDAMLFITVKSSEAEHVAKVLQVVEETKRIRHKAGLSEEELHQYVLYDTEDQKKGPRRINLDDDPKNKYAPPKNLTIHLSKISMPELQPKGHTKDKPSKDIKKREDKQASTVKPPRAAPPAPALVPPGPPLTKPSGNKLYRPRKASSPNQHVHAHQVHPNQPSPSPSQIDNPSIYTAPPPPPLSTRPTSSQGPRPPAPSFPQPYGGVGSSSSQHGSHAPYPGGNASTPSSQPMSWSLQTPAPYIHQPQPVTAAQYPASQSGTKPSSTASVVQGASTVVYGLMDKLMTHRR